MGERRFCLLPAYPPSQRKVHISCCSGIPSLVLAHTFSGFQYILKTSWDMEHRGLNNYWILKLLSGDSHCWTSWTTACKAHTHTHHLYINHTYIIHIYSFCEFRLEGPEKYRKCLFRIKEESSSVLRPGKGVHSSNSQQPQWWKHSQQQVQRIHMV